MVDRYIPPAKELTGADRSNEHHQAYSGSIAVISRIMQKMRQLLLLFGCIIVFSACRKEEEDPPIPEPITQTDPFTPSLTGIQGVQMNVDGDAVVLVHGGSLIPFYNADGNQDPPQSYKSFSSGLYDGSLGANVFELKIGTLSYTTEFLDPAAFQEFFNEGTRTYGPTTSPGQSHVAIEYTDPDGMLWSTLQGSMQQNGSILEFTDVATGYDDLGAWVKVIAHFNCNVFNASGTARTITNGELMLEYRDY